MKFFASKISFFCIATLFLFVVSVSVAYAQSTAGLVGWWTMDGINWTTRAVTDSSGAGNTGFVTNMATPASPAQGVIGNALSFDGVDDYVAASKVSALDGATSFSVSFWIKGNIPPRDLDVIFSQGADTNNRVTIQLAGTSGALYVIVGKVGNTFGTTPNGMLVNGTWRYMTMVFDGNQTGNSGRLKFYVNGSAVPFSSYNGTIPASSSANSSFYLGKLFPPYTRNINASLDDFRIYNRALSAQEVLNLYNYSLAYAQSTSGLVGWWTMDGINWTTRAVTDSSGAGNTGFVTNMAASASAPGVIGNALTFDGVNDYILVSTPNSLNVAGPITLSAWIKTTTLGPVFVVQGADLSSPYAGYGLRISSGKIDYSSGLTWVSGNTAINNDNWRHVTVSVTGTTATFYVDGVQDVVRSSAEATSFSGTRAIGATRTGSYGFPGLIDDVRIYNRALSAQEVLNLYNTGAVRGPDTGFAWSENIGWIELRPPGYDGVVREIDGDLVGYAWSENIGWIKFGGLTGFPTEIGNVKENARVGTDNVLEGWIRACAGMNDVTTSPINQTVPNNTCTGWSRTDGWDGWISLKGVDDTVSPKYTYQSTMNTDRASGDAWGSTVIGWINWILGATAPGSITLTAGECNQKKIEIKWTAPAAKYTPFGAQIPIAPSGYAVYRDGNSTPIYTLAVNPSAFVAGQTFSTNDTTVNLDQKYRYDVVASYWIGGTYLYENSSSVSATVQSSTMCPLPPSALTFSCAVSNHGSATPNIVVSWVPPSSSESVVPDGYNLYRWLNNDYSLIYSGSAVSYSFTGIPNTYYNFFIRSTYNGKESETESRTDCYTAPCSLGLSFTAPISVAYNSTASLSWDGGTATSCELRNSSGVLSSDLSGSYTTPALQSTALYTLACSRLGCQNSISKSIAVTGSPGSITVDCKFIPPNARSTPAVGQVVNFVTDIVGGTPPYTLTWTDTEGLDRTEYNVPGGTVNATTQNYETNKVLSRVYTGVGVKTITLSVVDSEGKTGSCSYSPDIKVAPGYNER